MRLASFVPGFLKPILRPIYHSLLRSRLYQKIFHRHKSLTKTHKYWEQPWDDDNNPEDYVKVEKRSEVLLEVAGRYADVNSNFLEIGCNAGRNLNHLFLSGYNKLNAIEISEKALNVLHRAYPEMAKHAKIFNSPVEGKIKEFSDNQFEIVFTMAVLEHIHKESEWIFPEIVRITKKNLILIEDEEGISWRTFPRNYKNEFERLGMLQVEEFYDVPGFPKEFVGRVFKKLPYKNIQKSG